jgi:lipopolysaccharide/colanic/teichoic acid biosynthesis glycosyltransferase
MSTMNCTLRQVDSHGGDHPLEVSGPAWYKTLKMVIEYVLAAILLVLTAPLTALIMIIVRLTSPGPVLYTQTRLGLGGRPYMIYKIRTMVQNCEKQTGPTWTMLGDPRITPVGRFLRRFHLDELPQLWNVLRGEMSLIGPRPERPEFVSHLECALPHYRSRMLVRPGLTGLAQVQLPPDSDLDSVRSKLAVDLYYVQRVSPLLDFQIMVSTVTYLLGVPFDVTRRVLGVPGTEDVIRDFQKLSINTALGHVKTT